MTIPAAFTAAHAAAARHSEQSFQIEREAEALLRRTYRLTPDGDDPLTSTVAFVLGDPKDMTPATIALWACGERTPADMGDLDAYSRCLRHTCAGMLARAVLEAQDTDRDC